MTHIATEFAKVKMLLEQAEHECLQLVDNNIKASGPRCRSHCQRICETMKQIRSDIQEHCKSLPTKKRAARVPKVETAPTVEHSEQETAEDTDVEDVLDIKPANVPKSRKAVVKRATRTKK